MVFCMFELLQKVKNMVERSSEITLDLQMKYPDHNTLVQCSCGYGQTPLYGNYIGDTLTHALYSHGDASDIAVIVPARRSTFYEEIE